MGTKLNPGKFDCYAKAAPDEPLFTLIARDATAEHLVRAWLAIQLGDRAGANQAMIAAFQNAPAQPPCGEKVAEALTCATTMGVYRKRLTRG